MGQPNGCAVVANSMCRGIGIGAVVSMFRIGAGTMQVLMHEERAMKMLAPVGREKFVTFSSWTLISNILYFSSAGAASLLAIIGVEVPLWIESPSNSHVCDSVRYCLFDSSRGPACHPTRTLRIRPEFRFHIQVS